MQNLKRLALCLVLAFGSYFTQTASAEGALVVPFNVKSYGTSYSLEGDFDWLKGVDGSGNPVTVAFPRSFANCLQMGMFASLNKSGLNVYGTGTVSNGFYSFADVSQCNP